MKFFVTLVALLGQLQFQLCEANDALVHASERGDIAAIEAELQAGANIEYKGKNATALIAAATAGHAPAVQLLISKGAGVSTGTHGGWSAILKACASGQTEVVKILLSAGESPNWAHKETGMSALMAASINGHSKTVELLLGQGARVDDADLQQSTALIKSALKGRTETASLLIKNGANLEHRARNGWTALMTACAMNHAETAEFLVGSGAKVYARSSHGQTALDLGVCLSSDFQAKIGISTTKKSGLPEL